eukprot:gene10654-11784_t
MDDTSDVSGVEQSTVSVRLINNGEVEEHLLGIIDCSKDTTASALTDILLTKLQDFKITPENCREKLIGQSYDGAGTMSGELNGVQKRVQDKFPAAYYNHCVAHRLSLCASQTANQTPQKIFKNFCLIWTVILCGPEIPSVRQRNGWREVESAIVFSESWKQKLIAISTEVTQKFTDQLLWRFSNLKKFELMDFIHPSKFAERRAVSQAKQKGLIHDLKNLYPFVVSDPLALEHNLSVLYSNSEIGILLEKTVRERDQVVAKKRERRRRLKKANEEHNQNKEGERNAIEDADYFERQMESTVEEDFINEGKPTVQDLLKVIKIAGLQDALPWVMKLLELAATTPLTSVHCERVFSRMKRVVSPSSSTILPKRKEML